MSRTQILLNVINDLEALTEDLRILCDVMKEGKPQQPTEVYPPEEEVVEVPTVELEPTVTLEQVRTVLAKIAQDGRQAEVKALITRHGASRLSDVAPSHYSAMLKEAEGLQ